MADEASVEFLGFGEEKRYDDSLLAVYPLYGAKFDHPTKPLDWMSWQSYGFAGGTTEICHPGAMLWNYLQPSDAIREPLLHEFDPPICVLCDAGLDPEHKTFELARSIARRLDREARRTIRALRLLREGWFMDPVLSEVIYASTSNSFFTRVLGPYRLAFHDETRIPFRRTDCYMVEAADLAETVLDTTPLILISRMLAKHEDFGGPSSVDIALENFDRSVGYQLTDAQSASLLFVALDAVMGGFSTRRIGRLHLDAPFVDRLSVAMRGAGSNNHELCRWVDTQCRRLRNAIAHGRDNEIDGADVLRLRSVIRELLLVYIAFSREWTFPSACSEMEAACGDGWKTGCTAAFNSLLCGVVRGRVKPGAFEKWLKAR